MAPLVRARGGVQMTPEDRFKHQQAAHRYFLAHFDRKELLALRQDVDEAIGYRESVQYFKDRGISIEGVQKHG